ncbi:tRNA lysidine(34) synthetase TilS [Aquibacillus sp. 3ASR75-11]|uniref:tRNA(Ile)-lysidine synthase n=1 Tax=Terrihalobacillus insolitus TaxID=2950438 RepID=A0A9X4ANB6_9BACI|nr:tRNA lysidine(34) synthetase TilS [Terrihalobacillus insolitus]MDC3426251.1 tRNA lysidine(34) synthetase TilS [Terrihalobacillus insolitus]
MNHKVNSFIEKHTLLKKGSTVLIGVSGGPDSMALLHFLHAIKQEWQLHLIALSVDHGLRGEESRQDIEYVKKMCGTWGIQFVGTYLDVPTYKKKTKKGTQVAAREMRYQFFEEQMEYFNATHLALGHHADDQAETMVMRFIRESQPKALIGIPFKRPFSNGWIIRPFLTIKKAELETYCWEHNIIPRRDPSNEDSTYTRNYVRNHILPKLVERNPNLHTNMQRLSESIASDESFLQNEAEKVVSEAVTFKKIEKEVVFNVSAFNQYAPSLQRRAFHLILNYLYGTIPKDVSYVHEEHFFQLLLSKRANTSLDFPMGLRVMKAYQTVLFRFEDGKGRRIHSLLPVPGKVLLPDGSTIISTFAKAYLKESRNSLFIDSNLVNLPLIVRSREPGDRIVIRGLNGSKKVKDVFIDEKIPHHQRGSWPIITDQTGNILWIIGLKKGITRNSKGAENFIRLDYNKTNLAHM